MLKTTEPVFVMTQKELDAIQAGREGGDAFALRIALKAIQLYAEMHPRPSHVTQVQAAQMLRVSRPTVRKLIGAGAMSLNECGLIPIIEVDRVLLGKAA